MPKQAPAGFKTLIRDFESELCRNNHNRSYVRLWDENPLLRDWYCGETFNFGSPSELNLQTIDLPKAIDIFNKIMKLQWKVGVAILWKGHPLLSRWYTKERVNLGDNENPDYQVISDEEHYEFFIAILRTQAAAVIRDFWSRSTYMYRWLENKPTVGRQAVPNRRLLETFECVLMSQSPHMTYAVWGINPLFQDWYMGKPVNLGAQDEPDMQVIRPDELVRLYKKLLTSRSKKIYLKQWAENSLLRESVLGKPGESSHEVGYSVMLTALHNLAACVAQEIYEKNEALSYWVNHPGENNAISYPELQSFFREVLGMRAPTLVRELWNRHAFLRSWLLNKTLPGVLPGSYTPLSEDETIEVLGAAAIHHHEVVVMDLLNHHPGMVSVLKNMRPEELGVVLSHCVITGFRLGEAAFKLCREKLQDDAKLACILKSALKHRKFSSPHGLRMEKYLAQLPAVGPSERINEIIPLANHQGRRRLFVASIAKLQSHDEEDEEDEIKEETRDEDFTLSQSAHTLFQPPKMQCDKQLIQTLMTQLATANKNLITFVWDDGFRLQEIVRELPPEELKPVLLAVLRTGFDQFDDFILSFMSCVTDLELLQEMHTMIANDNNCPRFVEFYKNKQVMILLNQIVFLLREKLAETTHLSASSSSACAGLLFQWPTTPDYDDDEEEKNAVYQQFLK